MRYEFAGYTFSPDGGLSRGDRPIRLTSKTMRFLEVLLVAGGRVVNKEELAKAVWGYVGATDTSVARLVYLLRSSMTASGGPEVIATIYNGGFRLSATIEVSQDTGPTTAHAITLSSNSTAIWTLISARELAARHTPQDLEAAAKAATMAVQLDSKFVSGWCTLAEIRLLQIGRAFLPALQGGRLVLEAANGALAVDPGCAAALAASGWVTAIIDRKVAEGLKKLDRALTIDRSFWGTYLLRAWVMQATSSIEEAIEMLRIAMRLNPAGTAIGGMLPLYLLFAGRRSESLAVARELALQSPTIDDIQVAVSTAASMNGLHDEAIECGEKAMQLAPHTPSMHVALAYALANAGQTREARNLLATIEAYPLSMSALTARVHLVLGHRATAIARLVSSFESHEPQFIWSRDDPRLESLRSEPVLQRLWTQIAR